MGAATKFLFDVDFAANDGKPERQAITLAEHALKLAEAETAAQRRGYEDARTDAGIEAERRMADALEHIAASLAQASDALKAIETRLECEAVEVAVAVARKLAPALIACEPFAEISALASSCFRELIASPHIAVRVNDELYAATREKLDAIARARGFEGRLVVLAQEDIAARRLPHRMGRRRRQPRQCRGRGGDRRGGGALRQRAPRRRRHNPR